MCVPTVGMNYDSTQASPGCELLSSPYAALNQDPPLTPFFHRAVGVGPGPGALGGSAPRVGAVGHPKGLELALGGRGR